MALSEAETDLMSIQTQEVGRDWRYDPISTIIKATITAALTGGLVGGAIIGLLGYTLGHTHWLC